MEEEHLIEEDEVETIPEKLIFYKDFLMNKDLQKDAKKYFTEDGWLTAMNTINSITSTSKIFAHFIHLEKILPEVLTGLNI